MTFDVRVSDSPVDFVERAGAWLERREDHHNLLLGLATARLQTQTWPAGDFFATVEKDGRVVGCVVRTPPHKALLTDIPVEAASSVAAALSERFEVIPATFGPRAAGEAVAAAWARLRGVRYVAGMPQGLYRLDRVIAATGVPGSMRLGTDADVERALAWGQGFTRDTGIGFPLRADSVRRWLDHNALFFWERDREPVSMAVAHGRTRRGVRIGYVYTPPERRGNGYAGGLVAELSQAMLDGGCEFCVLYTDLTNPTSNAIYRRIGYDVIAELSDFDFE
jgi:GNAT superfamily N-acetyltransferase